MEWLTFLKMQALTLGVLLAVVAVALGVIVIPAFTFQRRRRTQTQPVGAPPAGDQSQQHKSRRDSAKEWGRWGFKRLAIFVLSAVFVFVLGLLFDFWNWPNWATFDNVQEQWSDNFGWIERRHLWILALSLLLIAPFLPKGKKT